jgi:hypothetical protein
MEESKAFSLSHTLCPHDRSWTCGSSTVHGPPKSICRPILIINDHQGAVVKTSALYSRWRRFDSRLEGGYTGWGFSYFLLPRQLPSKHHSQPLSHSTLPTPNLHVCNHCPQTDEETKLADPSGRSLTGIVGSNPAGGHECPSLVNVMCREVVSATSLSLIQRSLTDCGASLCVILTYEQLGGGHRLRWATETRGEGGVKINWNGISFARTVSKLHCSKYWPFRGRG